MRNENKSGDKINKSNVEWLASGLFLLLGTSPGSGSFQEVVGRVRAVVVREEWNVERPEQPV